MKVAYGLVSIGFLIVLYLALYAIAHKYNESEAEKSVEIQTVTTEERVSE